MDTALPPLSRLSWVNALWLASLARLLKLLAMGIVLAAVIALLPGPASAPRLPRARSVPDAFVVQFSGEAVRSGPTYRLAIDDAPAFRVGPGIAVPVGTVDATVRGIVVDVASAGIGTAPSAKLVKAGVGRGSVKGSGGRPLYALSHVEWAGAGGYGVARGGVRAQGGKFPVGSTFTALFRIEQLAGGPGTGISRVSGSAVIEGASFPRGSTHQKMS